jgi:drug/metabolite transporter (DMT)-like permease
LWSFTLAKTLIIFAGIALTVLCWGSYGPVLHKGQHGLENNRLKPLICVGMAYFVVAIIVPTIYLASRGELSGGWSFSGTSWSLLAGAAGALGALGIIIALSSGGSPIVVMPLVFGGAPVLTVCIYLISSNTERPGPLFYAGLILLVVGATVVQLFKPKQLTAHQDQQPVASQPLGMAEKSPSNSD